MKKPVYWLYGEEDFLIEEKIKALKQEIVDHTLNIDSFDYNRTPLEEIISTLLSPPLFSAEKLVIINSFEPASEDQEELLTAFRYLPQGIRVVLRSSPADKRSKIFKFVSEQGETQEFRPVAPWETDLLYDWVREKVKSAGKSISTEANNQLVETSGTSLMALNSEIEKLITFIGEKKEISAEDVRALATPGEKDGFDLLAALVKKDLNRALQVFGNLQKNKVDPFQLLGLIASQSRLLLQIKALPHLATDPREVARQVGGNPYFVRKCLTGVSNFSLAELQNHLETILEAGQQLKTNQSQTVVMELLLTALCNN